MTPMSTHFLRGRLSHLAVAGLVLGLAWAGLHPLSAQGGRNDDRFVATWATAVVARPQGPPTLSPVPPGSPCAPPTFGPPPGRQGGGPPPTPPAPLNFTNQTLRQIVHTSHRRRARPRRAEQRVRHARRSRSARRTSRFATRTPRSMPKSDRAADVRRQPVDRRSPPAPSRVSDPVSLTVPAIRGSRDRSVSARATPPRRRRR